MLLLVNSYLDFRWDEDEDEDGDEDEDEDEDGDGDGDEDGDEDEDEDIDEDKDIKVLVQATCDFLIESQLPSIIDGLVGVFFFIILNTIITIVAIP